MGAASFLQTRNLGGKRRRKRGQWGTWEPWRGLEGSHKYRSHKDPFLLKLAQESLAQLHPLNDIIVFNKSWSENPKGDPQRGLSSSWEINQVLRIVDKGGSLCKGANYRDNQGKDRLRFCQDF